MALIQKGMYHNEVSLLGRLNAAISNNSSYFPKNSYLISPNLQMMEYYQISS